MGLGQFHRCSVGEDAGYSKWKEQGLMGCPELKKRKKSVMSRTAGDPTVVGDY